MALSPQVVQSIAHDGIHGDTLLGHLTRGDTVIPRHAPSAVHDIARQSMAAHGMDVSRFVAGAPGNQIDPKTGLHMFADGGSGGDSGGGGGGDSGGGGGGGGDTGGGGGSEGGGNGGGVGSGGDKSGGEQGSGGGAQGGDPSGGGPGDTAGSGPSGGGDKSGGSVGSGGGAQTDSGPSDTSNSSGGGGGTKSSTAAEEQGAVSNTASQTGLAGLANDIGVGLTGLSTSLSNAFSGLSGKSLAEALTGTALSDLTGAGKLGLGALPGGMVAQAVDSMTAHGVDQSNNPGGNVSAANSGGVGMGQGASTDPGSSSGGAGAEHPDTVQHVLNNQTVGGSGGGTAAPDQPAPPPQTTPAPQPLTDLASALAAARGLDRSPTFTTGSDADILKAILGPQHTTADQQLQQAHQRGTLSDTGFNSAELGLGGQDTAANSRLGGLSDNLLASYQQKLDAFAAQAIQSASGTQQGSPWDFAPWQSGYNTIRSTLQGREQGDLMNLLPSGGSLYDIPTLLANAGNTQGLYNPGGSPIQQALADQRGIGTTGSF